VRSLEFDPSSFEDLGWWIEQGRTQALRIVRLVREVQREPFSGLLVYQVLPDKIRILSCRYHY